MSKSRKSGTKATATKKAAVIKKEEIIEGNPAEGQVPEVKKTPVEVETKKPTPAKKTPVRKDGKIRVVHQTKGHRFVTKVVAESSQLKNQGYRIEDVKSE